MFQVTVLGFSLVNMAKPNNYLASYFEPKFLDMFHKAT